jgi:hypothetical protein
MRSNCGTVATSKRPSSKCNSFAERRVPTTVGKGVPQTRLELLSCHEKDYYWAKEGMRWGKAEANKQSAAKRDLGCNNAIALLALAFLPLH